MPIRTIQGAFNSGELSPHMLGRVDLTDYRSGARTILNWLVRPEGSVVRRSGTRYVNHVKDSSVKSRLVPFVFSTTQAYILEFSANLIRVFMDEAAVTETAKNITDVTVAAGVITVTSNGHGYSNGDEVFIEDVGGMVEINNRFFIVANQAANTFELSGIDGSGYTAYTSGGTCAKVYEVVTTYTEAEIPDLHFAQSADTLFIVHQSHAPATLTRTAHNSWTLADYEFIDGPYLEYRVPEVGAEQEPDTNTLNPSATTGDITVDSIDDLFEDPRDVGRMIRYGLNATAWGAMRATDVNNAKQVDATVTAGDDIENPKVLPSDLAKKYWYMGAYYYGNYPATVSFFEGRLCFAGTVEEPERIDGSVVGAWDDFRPSERADAAVNDDTAFSYQLGGANDVQVIRWLAPTRNLLMGTTGGVWSVQASSTNEAVTPTNVNLPRTSAKGCSSLQPVVVSDGVVYCSRTGKKIFVSSWSLEADSYRSDDLTLLADHITGSGITALAYQHEPFSIVWAVRSDGVLAGLSYEPEQKVWGWHRQIIGGSFGSGDAVVESAAVIPSPNGDHDQLWLVVKRTINGSTVRYIEFLEQEFAESDNIEDAFFVDAGSTYDGAAATTITNLHYLEGETVTVLADGAVRPDAVVSDGSITLATSASVVQIGYGYNSDLETLPLNLAPQATQRGPVAGRTMRPTHALLRLHRTLGLQAGPDSSNLSPIPFRAAGDPMDAPPPIFTGLKPVLLSHKHDMEGIVFLRKSDPLPATVLSIIGTTGVSQ